MSIWRDRTEAKVVRIVDGDTIRVDIDDEEYSVRYIGINTPETNEKGGANATNENRRLVAGQTVYLEKDVSDTDHYGRLLRNVFLEDGTFVNAELVKSGHAEVSTHLPDVRYRGVLEGNDSDRGRVGSTWLSAPAPRSIEEKELGTVGHIFGLFLTGERVSANILYEARKKLGFRAIDWIEEREEGELFKEISPSQALGIATAETKFLSVRGATSVALDILLDPLSYVGIGLIGKGAKAGKALKIGSKIDDTMAVVGPKGIQFLEETIQRGISRPTAEKKLLEAIGRGQTEYLAARKYAEPTVHLLGQKLLYTRPYQQAATKVWDALPYAKGRAKGVDVIKTAFIPFHKAAQDVGKQVKAPFLQFYRQTAYRTSKAKAEIKEISKKTPKKFAEDVANILEIPRLFRSAEEELAAREVAKVRDKALDDTIVAKGDSPFDTRATAAPEKVILTGMEEAQRKAVAILQAAEDTIATRKLATDAAKEREAQKIAANNAEEYAEAAREAARKAQNRANIVGTEKAQEFADTAAKTSQDLDVKAMDARKIAGPPDAPKSKAQHLKDAAALAEESAAIDEIRAKAQRDADTVLVRAFDTSRTEEAAIEVAAKADDTPFDTRAADRAPGAKVVEELEQRAPPPPEAEDAAAALRRIYDDAFQEKLEQGIVKEESYRQDYMHHAPSKKGRKWLLEEYGDTMKPPYKQGPLQQRKLEGTVQEANLAMYEKTGIEKFFIEDPYVATQLYMAKHARQMESHLLHKEIIDRYGRPTEAPPGLAPEIMKTGEIEYTLFEHSGRETYLPTTVGKELKRIQPKHSWWTDTYDPALGTLKKSWLAMWPGYYSRNIYGGVGWQNVLAGVELKDYERNLGVLYGDPDKMYDIPLYGKKTGAELKKLMDSHNVYGQLGYIGEPSSTGVLSPLGQIYQKYPEAAMKFSENQLRGPVFLHYLYKTGDPEYAADMVYKHHFEYLKGTYTAFEEDKLFRVVPFGKWTRGNVPLQTEMAFRQPGTFAALARIQDMSSTPEEYNQLTDWQRERTMYVHKGTAISVDLPVMDLPGMYGREDAYFGITPFFKHAMHELSGRDKYGRVMESPTTWAGVEQHAELAAEMYAGRYVYAARELGRTATGERPVSHTVIHQGAGVGVYDLAYKPERKSGGFPAFDEARWHEPTPTKEEEQAAWVAAGEPEDFHIKSLAGRELLVLTHELYEAAKGFKPTEEQLHYILTGQEDEPPGSREARYAELITEWKAFKAGELRLEQPTPEQEIASWRRAGAPSEYKQKIYRDDLGKLLGVSTFTPKEIEEMGSWQPTEAGAVWAFRDPGKLTPKEELKRQRQEHEETLRTEEERRVELEDLRTEYKELRTIRIQKGKDIPAALQIGGIDRLMARRRELENLLGEGVDR